MGAASFPGAEVSAEPAKSSSVSGGITPRVRIGYQLFT
jgi:hypothetical protein